MGELAARPCMTASLRLRGWQESGDGEGTMQAYGSDRADVEAAVREVEKGYERLHPDLPCCRGEVHCAA